MRWKAQAALAAFLLIVAACTDDSSGPALAERIAEDDHTVVDADQPQATASDGSPADEASSPTRVDVDAVRSCIGEERLQGDYEIVDLPFPFVDEGRARPLAVRVHLPIGHENPVPAVLVSHGGPGDPTSHTAATQYLGAGLAAYGYLAIHPNHTGTDPSTDRPLDVRFLLDFITEEPDYFSGLGVVVDPERIAIAGHSWGAYAALVAAGATTELVDGGTDPRLDAFIALSPQGPGQFGFDHGSWDEVDRPVYLLQGEVESDKTWDGIPMGEDWRRQVFDEMRPGDKYLSIIPDADHGELGRGDSELAIRTHDYVVPNVVAFLDTYLLGQDRTCEIGIIGAESRTVVERK